MRAPATTDEMVLAKSVKQPRAAPCGDAGTPALLPLNTGHATERLEVSVSLDPAQVVGPYKHTSDDPI
ncbi:hypothetical protein VTO73DRAFT_7087 [Trametes versicolor]